jgi:hypothetical protein
MTKLHADLPDLPAAETIKSTWDLPTPLDDIATALQQAPAAGNITLWYLAEVTDVHVNYHGAQWTPEDANPGGSELQLYLVGRLHDGRWIALEAWNDYTGWGCQDGSEAYIGVTREDVIANGITNDGRSALGMETV